MAYTMVINPTSPIKLVQRPMMPNGPRGFGITARRFIQEGEYIYVLELKNGERGRRDT